MDRYSQERSRSRQKSRERRKEERKEPVAKLYAGNIDSRFTEEEIQKELRTMCEKYGEIVVITVKTRAGSDHAYAFVQFKKLEDAQKAVENLKGTLFKGKEIKIELGKGGRRDNGSKNNEGCYICSRDGHYARDCPQRDRRNGRRDGRYERKRSDSRDYDRRRRSRSYDRHRRDRRRYSSSRSDERRRDDRKRSPRSRSRSYGRKN